MFSNPVTLLQMNQIVGLVAVFIPIIAILGGFLLAFAISYLRYKDRQAMIEKGLDPGPNSRGWGRYAGWEGSNGNRRNGQGQFTGPLFIIGAGLGLLTAYLVTNSQEFKGDETPIYFGSIAVLAGMGLLIGNLIERKLANKENPGTTSSTDSETK